MRRFALALTTIGLALSAFTSIAADDSQRLSHGPILGAVTDSSARIWVRASDTAAYQIAHAPSVGGVEVVSEPVVLDASSDFTGVIELTGLGSGQSYTYRALLDGEECFSGTLQTLPAVGEPAIIRFAYAADVSHLEKPFIGFDALAARLPDFLILGGDNVYVDHDPVVADTKAAYEQRYRETWDDASFRAAMQRVPTLMAWDDHELLNNWDAGRSGRYANARAVFDEYQAGHNPDPVVPGELYYTCRAGELDFFVLDTRTHRSPNDTPDGPSKSMLGEVQRDALLDWLDTSEGVFKVIVTSVPFHRFADTKDDAWAGANSVHGAFRTERAQIFEHIRDNRIAGVVMLSGDQHWAGVFRLSELDPVVVHEFMPTPIAVSQRVPSLTPDPDILYADSAYRGFGLFTADTTTAPATLRFEWIDETGVVRHTLDLASRQPLEGTVKPKIVLSFRKTARDKLTLAIKGMRLPTSLTRSGASVTVDIGGARFEGVLDRKGRFKSADRRDRISLKKKRTAWTLLVSRKKLDLAPAFADEGLLDETNGKPGKPVTLDVAVIVNGTEFSETVELSYRSKAGKKGTATR